MACTLVEHHAECYGQNAAESCKLASQRAEELHGERLRSVGLMGQAEENHSMLMAQSRAKGREKEALCENREHWLQTGYQELEGRVHDHEASPECCEPQLRA